MFYCTLIIENIILLYDAIMKNICIFEEPKGKVCKDFYQRINKNQTINLKRHELLKIRKGANE